MKKEHNPVSYVLDTSAVFTLWNDEAGAETVERILRSKVTVYISFMTVMEGRYRLWKDRGKRESDEFYGYLRLLELTRTDMSNELLETAIKIKSSYNLSVCDAWIIASAISSESILVHKDPEFEQVNRLVKLNSLPYK